MLVVGELYVLHNLTKIKHNINNARGNGWQANLMAGCFYFFAT